MKKAEGRRQKQNAPRRVHRCFRMLPSAFCVLLVRLYQLTLSPAKTFLLGPAGNCRFEPSCSQYAVEALKTHGAVAGSWLAAKRVCRCHPWGGCGEDPVPAATAKAQSPESPVPTAELQVSNVGFRF
jgi:putative membrane protein insertion efficiency factor